MKANHEDERDHRMAGDVIETDSPLTGRERTVLLLVAKAQSNKEIAVSLKISPSTVKRHLENILRKLDLKNRVEAAVYALRMRDCPLGERPGNCPILVVENGKQEKLSNWAIWPIDGDRQNMVTRRQ